MEVKRLKQQKKIYLLKIRHPSSDGNVDTLEISNTVNQLTSSTTSVRVYRTKSKMYDLLVFHLQQR